MRATHQLKYAIYGIFDLAYHGGSRPIPIQVIGQRQGIPARYLEQIFQRLRRAQVVASKRGPGGGYTLARPAAEITLREVVEAVEGPLTSALASPAAPDSASGPRRPDFVWKGLAERFAGVLDDTDLEQLCIEAERADVERVQPDAPMYFI